jgi:large conductance mechanosensitive channel
MSFIKEFKQFALRGNLVDIAVAFVMGGAFGKVVSAFTEKLILKQAVNEVRDPSGNIIIANGKEVALEWGAVVTAVIDFIIVAFVMFLVIKAINTLKKKEATEPVPISKTDQLLTEIKDLLSRK